MRRGNLSMSRPKCRRGRPARRRVSCCAQGLGKDQRDEIHPDAFRRAIKTPVPPCVCGASLRAQGGRTSRPCASDAGQPAGPRDVTAGPGLHTRSLHRGVYPENGTRGTSSWAKQRLVVASQREPEGRVGAPSPVMSLGVSPRRCPNTPERTREGVARGGRATAWGLAARGDLPRPPHSTLHPRLCPRQEQGPHV